MIEQTDPWLREMTPSDDAVVRLLCLPRAGGSAQDFFDWAERISERVHLCCVQLPGRHERFLEQAIDRMEPIVHESARLAKTLTDLPLVLFGDCMGALIGYELARELRRTNEPQPASLIVASYPPPDHPRTGTIYHDAPWQLVKEHLEAIGDVSKDALEEEELFKLILPMLRADFAVYETYQYVPAPPIESEIHVIGGAHDPYYSATLLEGWKHHTSGEFSLQMFDGDHAFVQRNADVLSHIEQLALRHGTA